MQVSVQFDSNGMRYGVSAQLVLALRDTTLFTKFGCNINIIGSESLNKTLLLQSRS